MKNDELLHEALDNVRNDRMATEDLLADLISKSVSIIPLRCQSPLLCRALEPIMSIISFSKFVPTYNPYINKTELFIGEFVID